MADRAFCLLNQVPIGPFSATCVFRKFAYTAGRVSFQAENLAASSRTDDQIQIGRELDAADETGFR